jgi:hypothetical protein
VQPVITASPLYGNAKSAKLDRFSIELLNKVAIIQRIVGRGALAEIPETMMLRASDKAAFRRASSRESFLSADARHPTVRVQMDFLIEAHERFVF